MTGLPPRLEALRRRHRAVVAVDRFLEFAFVLAGGVGIVLLLDRLAFEFGLARLHAARPGQVALAFGASLAAAAAAALAAAWILRPSAAALAWRADKVLRSDERILTAVGLEAGSPFSDLVRAEADAALERADFRKVLPWPAIGYRGGLLVALGAGALLAFLPPVFREGIPGPHASISVAPLRGVAPLVITAEDQSQGAVTSRRWEFGDGDSSSAAGPVDHLYSRPGRYVVRLAVAGPGGADGAEAVVEVLDAKAPFADFLADPRKGRAPLDVRFRNASRNATTFAWSFGDGATSTEADPVHRYAAPGLYTVSLAAGGDRVERKAYIKVVGADAPLADFRAFPRKGPAPLVVAFEDNSTGKIESWDWDFGDRYAGASRASSERAPSHEYRQPGRYTVRLKVRGPGGEDVRIRERYVEVTGDGSGGGGGGAGPLPEFATVGASRESGPLFGDPSARRPAEFKPETVEGAPKGDNLVEKVKNVYSPGGDPAAPPPPPASYPQVFGEYRRAAEDSMTRERIPPGLRDSVKRYFDSIRPR